MRNRSMLKKAMDLISQNREMSLEENYSVRKADEMKAKRLKISENRKENRQKRKSAATPEEIEAKRTKKVEQIRLFRQKRKVEATPEEKETMRLKARKYLQNKRDQEESILKKAMKLLSQNQQLSLEENDIMRKAEDIKAKRLKRKQKYRNCKPEEVKAMKLRKSEQNRRAYLIRKAKATPEEKEAIRLKSWKQRRQNRQDNRERKKSVLRQALELLRQNQENYLNEIEADEIKVDRLRVFDEIKIENEVLQETTIKAISARQNANSVLDMQQGGYNYSSCSWLELSEKSFMTGKTSSYFQSFHEGLSSIQFDRRKLGLEKSFRCMRKLIDATAKRNGLALFGKQIAQKLRSSKKNVTEVNIAKQLIDDILENLAIGVYSFETEIV